MRVLLISPLRGLDPPCGDITYTETLQQHPPEGVVYETYAEAIERGALVEHARRSSFCREPVLTIASKAVNLLRKRRWLFWEPFRFFSVKPGEYDLIHLHVFNARFFGLACPLVVSSGAPQRDVYLDRRHYQRRWVDLVEICERLLCRVFQMNHNSYQFPQAQKILVYTEYFRDYLVNNGYAEAWRVAVVPILSLMPSINIKPRPPKRIGFVAHDFDAKSGPTVLEAYKQIRKQRPDVELWIVGSPPQLSPQERDQLRITWLNTVPREQLLGEIMPSFDIFAYPTPHDCFSYVTLEAMSCGVAIATSDYVSMPEAVDYGRAGLISPVGDAAGLAKNILTLLDTQNNFKFRLAARKRFDEHFSWNSVAPRILDNYEEAIKIYQSRPGNCTS